DRARIDPDCRVNVRFMRKAAKAEANGALRQPVGELERPQHVGRFAALRIAGGTGRHAERLECQHQALAVYAVDADVQDSREAVPRIPVPGDAADVPDALPQARIQALCMRKIVRLALHRDRGSRAQPYDLVNWQSAGPQAAFLAAAMEQRSDAAFGPVGQVQGADALRPVELVPCQGHEVHGQRGEVNRQLAGRLRGIAVEKHAVAAAGVANLMEVLYYACLVVDVHDRYELRVGANRGLEIANRQEPALVRLEPCHLEALTFQCGEAVCDGLVFGRHADE